MNKSFRYLINALTYIVAIFFSQIVVIHPALANTANAKVSFAPLPEAISNNAVTQVSVDDKHYILSFSGLGEGKGAADVNNKTFILDLQSNTWRLGKNVPITTPIISVDHKGKKQALSGRLASVAASIGKDAYVFGGYTVGFDHTEVSIPDVYKYELSTNTFTSMSPMPVPVDDSVALVYQERYIYLISGWHNDGNVNLVQVFDTQTNTWQQASPFPGKPVFGQAGGIVGNTMVICDGVSLEYHAAKRRSFGAELACFIGRISADAPNKIDWRTLDHPTGKARYRMAAFGDEESQQIIFVGGSDNPYNYNGIGYNGEASKADGSVWRYNLQKDTWSVKAGNVDTMDHRGLIKLTHNNTNIYLTIGGMNSEQAVLNTVNIHTIHAK